MSEEKVFSGEVLREFRKAHKLTQVELAKLLDINRTYLARLETGEKVPSKRLQNEIERTFKAYEDGRGDPGDPRFVDLVGVLKGLNGVVGSFVLAGGEIHITREELRVKMPMREQSERSKRFDDQFV